MNGQQQVAARLLRRPAVQQMTTLPRSTLYRFVKEGKFPKPIRLGPRYVAWLLADVEAWIEFAQSQAKAALQE